VIGLGDWNKRVGTEFHKQEVLMRWAGGGSVVMTVPKEVIMQTFLNDEMNGVKGKKFKTKFLKTDNYIIFVVEGKAIFK